LRPRLRGPNPPKHFSASLQSAGISAKVSSVQSVPARKPSTERSSVQSAGVSAKVSRHQSAPASMNSADPGSVQSVRARKPSTERSSVQSAGVSAKMSCHQSAHARGAVRPFGIRSKRIENVRGDFLLTRGDFIKIRVIIL
jgi:hypothetical protein